MKLVPVRLAGASLSDGFPAGLAAGSPLTVVVVDPRGTPFSGAQVTLQGQAMPVSTDSSGIASFTAPAGDVVVQVKVAGFTLRARGTTDQTLFVTVPVCAPGPILTITEMVAMLVGGSAVIGGMVYKKRAAEMFGEILVGASVFNAIFRNSCRW